MRTAVTLLLSLCFAESAAGQERNLDPAELRSVAVAAANVGQANNALDMSAALLERDPEDVAALLVRSNAARQLGRFDEASEAASRAWRAAGSAGDRYAAALAKAQALSSRGNRMMAQLWLRRAAHVAPTNMHRAMAAQDFRYVKRRNPWRLDLSFSVSPVSNINNGSRKGQGTYELPFFGVVEAELSGAALPLSGTEIQTGVALRYRLDDRGRNGTTDLRVIASRRDYRLSDEARETAPDVEGSDFAFSSAQVVLSHTGQIEGGDLSYQLGATLARTWYAGAPYSQSADLSGALHVPITPRRGIALQLGLRREEALSPLTADARGWRGAIGWRGEFGEPGHRLFFDLERAQSVSENAAQDWGKFGIDMRVKLARPVLGVALNFGLSAAEKRFDRSPVAGRDRTDRSIDAEIAATVPQLDFYGFMPRVSVSARRTESDFDQYDTQEIGLRLGFRSAF